MLFLRAGDQLDLVELDLGPGGIVEAVVIDLARHAHRAFVVVGLGLGIVPEILRLIFAVRSHLDGVPARAGTSLVVGDLELRHQAISMLMVST
jgi:hypothetical protein